MITSTREMKQTRGKMMETYNFAENKNNTASFYITQDLDVIDTISESCGQRVVAEVVVDNLFVGTLDEMRTAAQSKYLDATNQKADFLGLI